MNITTPFTLKPHFYLRATIVACLISVVAWAQPQKFQKVYGGYSYDQGNDLIQLPDTGYLLLCTSGSFSSSSDIYLLKVDKQGNYEWQHTYGGQDIEGACKIKLTQDGHIAMAGHTNSYPGKSYDFYLVKAALNGDTVWTKHYGSNEWDFANSMDTCADGGFIMAGKTYDTGNAFSDILIVKTDADGNELWQKKIGGNKDDVANSIISLVDGYILCGTTESIGAGGKDIYVVKVDLNGNVIWERTLGGAEDDVGNSSVLTFDGKILCAGGVKSFGFPLNFNSYLMKLNADGTDFWSPPGNFSASTVNFEIVDIVESNTNQIVSISDFDNNGLSNGEFGLFINDSNGYLDTSSTFGGSLIEKPHSIIRCFDKGYAILGTTTSFGLGLENIFLVKTDTLGSSNLTMSILVGESDKSYAPINEQNVFFPNPFQSIATLTLEGRNVDIHSKSLQLNLFNEVGSSIYHGIDFEIAQNGKDVVINITNLTLSDGIYFYHLIANDKTIAQGKFTVIK